MTIIRNFPSLRKKYQTFDQISGPFLTKLLKNEFLLVFSLRLAVFTGMWKVNSQAYSDQTFSRGFIKVGTIRFIDKPVPALGI